MTKNGYRDSNLNSFGGEWSQNSRLNSDAFGFVNRINWDLGLVTFTTVTGYENMDKITEEDFDGTPFALGDSSYETNLEVFTQEVRFTSNEPFLDRVNYLAGLVYYMDQQEENDLFGYVDRVNHDVLLRYSQETTSWAVFIHTETRILDQLKFIAGFRYTEDDIDFRGSTSIVNEDPDGFGPQPIFVEPGLAFNFANLHPGNLVSIIDDSISTNEVTGKIGLNWTPSDDLLLYVNFSRGYKAGGYVGFWTTLDVEFGPYNSEFYKFYRSRL